MFVNNLNNPCPHTLPIFDFDGVIADSRTVIFEVINTLIAQRGLPPVSAQDMHDVNTRVLLRRMHIRFWQIPKLVTQARAMVFARRHALALHPQIVMPFETLAKHTPQPVILSSNGQLLIESFFTQHLPQVPQPYVVGGVSLFGKHRALRALLKARGLPASAGVYIGDEVRDVEAARRVGMPSIAVCWGKDSEAALRAAQPTHIAKDGPALLAALQRVRI